jgi:hypothetical protein
MFLLGLIIIKELHSFEQQPELNLPRIKKKEEVNKKEMLMNQRSN